ncbi:hypothetical protein ACROYT_G026829 [Oculina patagonica]
MADEQEEIWGANEAEMDFRKMKQTHEVAGYREGLESGKETNLQQGFNQGFIYGANISREWGKLRGVLSALMSFASAKSIHDLNPNVTAEITELLALVSQMEKHALDIQAMQCALESRMNQTQHSLEPLEVKTEPVNHHKALTSSDEHKLSSAFEMLHIQDKTKDTRDLTVKCKTTEKKVETRSDLMDTAMPALTSHSGGTLEATRTVPVITELENLWSRIVSVADKIGLSSQKILLVKNI